LEAHQELFIAFQEELAEAVGKSLAAAARAALQAVQVTHQLQHQITWLQEQVVLAPLVAERKTLEVLEVLEVQQQTH
jgi:hypothetical protein